MPKRQVPDTEEGLLMSHLMFTIERGHPDFEADAVHKEAEDVIPLMRNYADQDRFDLVRLVSSEADFMTILIADSMEELDDFQREFVQSGLGRYVTRKYTFLSVSEVSYYTPPDERVERELEESDMKPGTDEYEKAKKKRMKRMEKYEQMRLNPEIPDMPYVTFYPMAKRRDKDANWYQLPHQDRAEMMASHGKIGRKYSAQIQQFITSCVGLDDWEWGVTLYGHDPRSFKRLIYEMRFDEVSAKYSDFGPFYTGYSLELDRFPELF